MTGLLLLTAIVAAKQVACEPRLTETAPSPAMVDVPVDAAIALVFEPGCETELEYSAVLRALAEPAPLLDVAVPLAAGENRIAWIPVDGGLAPDTDYLLTVLGAYAEQHDIAFRTGTRSTEAYTGQPVAGPTASAYYRDRWVEFQTSVEPVPSPDGHSVLGIVDEADPDVIVGGGVALEDARDVVGGWRSLEKPEEACIRAVQWDAAGRVVGESEILCEEPMGSGCATTPHHRGAAVVVLAVAALRRRTRATVIHSGALTTMS